MSAAPGASAPGGESRVHVVSDQLATLAVEYDQLVQGLRATFMPYYNPDADCVTTNNPEVVQAFHDYNDALALGERALTQLNQTLFD